MLDNYPWSLNDTASGTYTLHDFQSHEIAVLITLHNCLPYNRVCSSCGLHITQVFGNRGSHIARHLTDKSAWSPNYAIVNKTHVGSDKGKDRTTHETGVLSSKN